MEKEKDNFIFIRRGPNMYPPDLTLYVFFTDDFTDAPACEIYMDGKNYEHACIEHLPFLPDETCPDCARCLCLAGAATFRHHKYWNGLEARRESLVLELPEWQEIHFSEPVEQEIRDAIKYRWSGGFNSGEDDGGFAFREWFSNGYRIYQSFAKHRPAVYEITREDIKQ
jgi:hypothetical protein